MATGFSGGPNDPDKQPSNEVYWPTVGRSGGWPRGEDPWTLDGFTREDVVKKRNQPPTPRPIINLRKPQSEEQRDRDWLNQIQFRENLSFEQQQNLDNVGKAFRDMFLDGEIIAEPDKPTPNPAPKRAKKSNKSTLPEPPVV